MTPAPPPLVLASASPRRAEILETLGLAFEVRPARVPETLRADEAPDEVVRRLAGEKARSVAGSRPDALVLAGDTVVALDGAILGKPRDESDAVAMLLRLSGRTHRVHTALALASPGEGVEVGSAAAEVSFRSFGAPIARAYAATGEPLDKAGAYGIQGRGSALVSGISGDYYAVVGLPVTVLLDLLERAGWAYRFGAALEAAASVDPGSR